MPLRSMTGFAQVKGELRRQASAAREGQPTMPGLSQKDGRLAFSLSLKSVNHRFLDLHFRMPSGTDSLETHLRRLLKEKVARGHIEVTLSLERSAGEVFALNRDLVGGYIAAFRAAAAEFSLASEPDLNAVLRIPGALDGSSEAAGDDLEAAVMSKVDEALERLNQMREEEGRSIERELRQRMTHLVDAGKHVQQHRRVVLQNYMERLQARVQELLGATIDNER